MTSWVRAQSGDPRKTHRLPDLRQRAIDSTVTSGFSSDTTPITPIGTRTRQTRGRPAVPIVRDRAHRVRQVGDDPEPLGHLLDVFRHHTHAGDGGFEPVLDEFGPERLSQCIDILFIGREDRLLVAVSRSASRARPGP